MSQSRAPMLTNSPHGSIVDADVQEKILQAVTGLTRPRIDHLCYEYRRKSGMEPWFQCWEAVRYAIEQFKIEWANHKAYMRTGGVS